MITEIVLFAVGIIVGAMNAIAGGGLLLGFPVLMAAGLPPLAANMTGNLIVAPGNITSAFGYRKLITKLSKKYLILIIPCIIGAAIGASILRHTSSDQFTQIVPILVFAAVVLFIFQPFLHAHLHKHIRGKLKGPMPLVLISLALLPMSIYGGYFGAGFGFILLAFLGFTKLHDLHQMNGLKNLAGICISVTSLICLYGTGMIDWKLGLAMGAGSAVGGYYGSHFSQKISSHTVRGVVIITGLTTAAYLAIAS